MKKPYSYKWSLVLATAAACGVLVALDGATVRAGGDSRFAPPVAANCPTLSTGADFPGSGNIANLGQALIGRSSGGGVVANVGAIYCFAPRVEHPGCANPCGDPTNDGVVDLNDFLIFVGCFDLPVNSGPDCPCADMNGDLVVDLNDVLIFVNLFDVAPSTNTPPNCGFQARSE